MSYVTVPQSPMYHQFTLEELLTGKAKGNGLIRMNIANTRTIITDKPFGDVAYINNLINILHDFNVRYADLASGERTSLYHQFFIPKPTGGLREINAPCPELMIALTELKTIFEESFGALYHTSAYAYIKQRSTVDAIKKHQQNDSKWFLKTDFSNFFGSTTPKFVLKMLKMIRPFDVVCEYGGEEELIKALDLCFLKGGLPMGAPISPMLTNLIMIPIDYHLCKNLKSGELGQHYIYTRYADDMLISSYKPFKFTDMVDYINSILKQFDAPFALKPSKTRYGSRAGANWNLGLMLNKDNKITIGHKRKKTMRAMIHNYLMDKKNNISWPIEDVQTMNGQLSYFKMIESEYVDAIIESFNAKFNTDVMALIKADISC